ncbi:methyltransferase [Pseudoscourfieldia marina]
MSAPAPAVPHLLDVRENHHDPDPDHVPDHGERLPTHWRARAVAIPLSELDARAHELPPPCDDPNGDDAPENESSDANVHVLEAARERRRPLWVIHDPKQAHDVAAWFNSRKRHTIRRRMVVPGDDTWNEALATQHDDTSLEKMLPPPRLWMPSPALTATIDAIEASAFQNGSSTPCAVDLGCGVGRDAVLLASRGWDVVAVDSSVPALEKCTSLARKYAGRNGGRIQTLQVDMRKVPTEQVVEQVVKLANPAQPRLYIGVRFLHRPLLHHLACTAAVGCHVLWSHFMDGCQAWGHPLRERDILLQNELVSSIFSASRGWRTLFSHEGAGFAEDARPLATLATVRDELKS